MSNLIIRDIEDLVLPRFSDIKIGTFYKYQGLDGFRLKIDKYYFYDLERQMTGVENHHAFVWVYKPSFDIKRSLKIYPHDAIKRGDVCLISGFCAAHLAIKIANNEFFDLEANQVITLKNTDHEFEVPDEVCVNFIADLEDIGEMIHYE